MIYFDCNCEVGPRPGKDAAAPWSTREVLRWMDHCGIAGALVVHTLAINNDPVQARELLDREVALAPKRLFPAWVVVPPDAGDELPLPALLAAMRKRRIRAVKLFPAKHNWPLAMPVIGPLLEALEREQLLTMINFSELPEGKPGGCHHQAYCVLSDLLRSFPRLPLLLHGISWGSQRVITALMARHENLHIEFSSYQINRGLEEYCRRFGSERLLLGTGLPAMSAGAARAYVDYARISGAEKERIAGGNLMRLLGVRPASAPARPADALRDRAAAGKALRVPVLDAHCHVLHEGANAAGGYVMYRGDADGIVELKDRMGIRQSALMSWVGPVAGEPVGGNAIVAAAVRKYPDHFWGVASVNPTHLTRGQLMAEVRKRVEREGFVGLKPYGNIGLRYNDPLYAPCWEYANARGLYTLLHTGGPAGGTEVVSDLAKRHPQAQWVVAHTGGSFSMARSIAGVMKQHPNVWAELTLTPVTNGVIEWLASEVGDDRILFGTDAPMRDPRPQFGWVIWADLPVASRKRILGGNFQRLLGMRKSSNEKKR